MEKKYRVLIVLVVVLSGFVLALGGFVVYDKVLKDEKPNVGNNSNSDVDSLANKYKDYTFVDLTKQETFKLGHTVSYDSSDRIELGFGEDGVFFGKDNENKKAYLEVDGNKTYVDIANVSKIYAYHCCKVEYSYDFYILTEDGTVFSNFVSGNNSDPSSSDYVSYFASNFKKVNTNISFEKLGKVTFDFYYPNEQASALVGMDFSGNVYYVGYGKKFDNDFAYYFGYMEPEIAIKTNGEVYEVSEFPTSFKKTSVKVKKIISDNHNKFIFLDTDNYLRVIETNYAGENIGLNYKKISDKKVNSVFVKIVEDKTYLHVVYEDSTVQDFEY